MSYTKEYFFNDINPSIEMIELSNQEQEVKFRKKSKNKRKMKKLPF